MSKELENQGKANAQAETTPSNSVTPSPLVAALPHEKPDWAGASLEAFGEVTITVPGEKMVEMCSYSKTAPAFEFKFLADMCAADHGPEAARRVEVTEHLSSTTKH